MGLKDNRVYKYSSRSLTRRVNGKTPSFCALNATMTRMNLNILAFLAVIARFSIAETVGYFEDSSVCADPDGLATCYEKADDSYTSCISNNCAGGSSSCVKSCNGDRDCIVQKCPNLGVDCINACGCVRAGNQIDCTASSCWNQVSHSIHKIPKVF